MTNFDPENPLEKIYTALWEGVENTPGLSTLLLPANKLRYDHEHKSDPANPTARTTIDNIELGLIPVNNVAQIHATSNSSKLNAQFQWIINTGDWRLNHGINQITWQLFIAHQQCAARLYELTYKDKPFIELVDLLTNTIGTVDPVGRSALPVGWSGLWSVDITMKFKTQDLK